jgi:hypothetical protein
MLHLGTQVVTGYIYQNETRPSDSAIVKEAHKVSVIKQRVKCTISPRTWLRVPYRPLNFENAHQNL